jgi:hypothetical protein
MAGNFTYPKIAQMHTAAALLSRIAELGLELPIDEQILSASDGSPLAAPINCGGIDCGGFNVANRWCIHAMEGWNANPDGGSSGQCSVDAMAIWLTRPLVELLTEQPHFVQRGQSVPV